MFRVKILKILRYICILLIALGILMVLFAATKSDYETTVLHQIITPLHSIILQVFLGGAIITFGYFTAKILDSIIQDYNLSLQFFDINKQYHLQHYINQYDDRWLIQDDDGIVICSAKNKEKCIKKYSNIFKIYLTLGMSTKQCRFISSDI